MQHVETYHSLYVTKATVKPSGLTYLQHIRIFIIILTCYKPNLLIFYNVLVINTGVFF